MADSEPSDLLKASLEAAQAKTGAQQAASEARSADFDYRRQQAARLAELVDEVTGVLNRAGNRGTVRRYKDGHEGWLAPHKGWDIYPGAFLLTNGSIMAGNKIVLASDWAVSAMHSSTREYVSDERAYADQRLSFWSQKLAALVQEHGTS